MRSIAYYYVRRSYVKPTQVGFCAAATLHPLLSTRNTVVLRLVLFLIFSRIFTSAVHYLCLIFFEKNDSLFLIFSARTCFYFHIIQQAFFFVHFAKNSGRKKTQVLALFGKTQPNFCKTQVKFSQKSSDLLNKDLQKLRLKLRKLRFPRFGN